MADCKVIQDQVSEMHASWNPKGFNAAKHPKQTYQLDQKDKLTDETMYEFMVKTFNSSHSKKRNVLNAKSKGTLKKKASFDDETIHAFEHLSLLNSDDEAWDTMEKSTKAPRINAMMNLKPEKKLSEQTIFF